MFLCNTLCERVKGLLFKQEACKIRILYHVCLLLRSMLQCIYMRGKKLEFLLLSLYEAFIYINQIYSYIKTTVTML